MSTTMVHSEEVSVITELDPSNSQVVLNNRVSPDTVEVMATDAVDQETIGLVYNYVMDPETVKIVESVVEDLVVSHKKPVGMEVVLSLELTTVVDCVRNAAGQKAAT